MKALSIFFSIFLSAIALPTGQNESSAIDAEINHLFLQDGTVDESKADQLVDKLVTKDIPEVIAKLDDNDYVTKAFKDSEGSKN